MTSYDFSPLFRSTVGFDQLMALLERSARLEGGDNGYPPYNIEKRAGESYRIVMAVAGFGEDELDIELRDQTLQVSGQHRDDGADRTFLHRGIAGRAFRRSFQLADHVQVVGAKLEKGLLSIDLVREVPEEKRPRRIEISSGGDRVAGGKPALVGDGRAA